MTKVEKRNNARIKVVAKIIENILFVSGSREVVEGPRGSELLELMKKETHDLLTQFEERYVLGLEDE